jgi:hypothetical protein
MWTQIFHFLFDYFIRLGWLDPIEPEEAKMALPPVSICELGRGTDAGGFAHVIKVPGALEICFFYKLYEN